MLYLLLGCVMALDLDAATMNINLAESNLHTNDCQKLQGVIDLIASIAVLGGEGSDVPGEVTLCLNSQK